MARLAMDARSRSRERTDTLPCRRSGPVCNYHCALCKERLPSDWWQDWQEIVDRDEYINLLEPTYRDAQGRVWAAICRTCQRTDEVWHFLYG